MTREDDQRPDLFGEAPAPAEELRARYRHLVMEELPAAAKGRGADQAWPVHLDHCFARILLDHACGRPWREVIQAPAWRNAPAAIIARAVSLGEAILTDRVDLWALNRQSLDWRGKQGPKHARRG
ncbi:MAG: GCN5-related N-acetyltransferase [Pseudomonadota bacterium]